jgi:hypothetical protein
MEVVQVVKTGQWDHRSALDASPANPRQDGGNRSQPDPVRGGLKALDLIRELPTD